MKYNFDKIVNRRGTSSVKWDSMKSTNPAADGCLPFWIADMDFPCSDAIQSALHETVDREIYGYSFYNDGEYFRAVCGWFLHRFDWYVDSSDIFYAPGVVPALSFLVDILTNEGDGIIIQQPVYTPFMNIIKARNRKISNNPLNYKDGDYEIDFEKFEELAKMPENKLFIFCSPHNPVGKIWSLSEMQRLIEICQKYDLFVIVDEIHHDFVRKPFVHVPVAKVCPQYKHKIITCTAPSKSFNIAGLQVSNIIIHNEDVKSKWVQYVNKTLMIENPTPFGIEALKAAYYESEKWIDEANDYIMQNFYFIEDYLKNHAPKAVYKPSNGTYLAWVDVRAYIYDNASLCKELIEDRKVMFSDGVPYGLEEGQGFLRINAACSRELLEQGLDRLVSVLNRVREDAIYRDFTYSTPFESLKKFSDIINGNEKTFLLFLRYFGCTICKYELMMLKNNIEKFEEAGIKPVVVLQSSVETMLEDSEKDEFPFEIICDPDGELYSLYSVSPAISSSQLFCHLVMEKIDKAKKAGIVHGKYEGNEMQLPASFLIDKSGKVLKAVYSKSLDISKNLESLGVVLNEN